MSDNIFDTLMKTEVWSPAPCDDPARSAIFEVVDTMRLCVAWWKQYAPDIQPAAADVLEMARMIIARHDVLIRRHDGDE